MKTKCLISLVLTFCVVSLIGCDDENDENDKRRLPETARAFIENRLPGYQILNLEEVDDKEDELNEKYIVTFSDDVLVSRLVRWDIGVV